MGSVLGPGPLKMMQLHLIFLYICAGTRREDGEKVALTDDIDLTENELVHFWSPGMAQLPSLSVQLPPTLTL